MNRITWRINGVLLEADLAAQFHGEWLARGLCAGREIVALGPSAIWAAHNWRIVAADLIGTKISDNYDSSGKSRADAPNQPPEEPTVRATHTHTTVSLAGSVQ